MPRQHATAEAVLPGGRQRILSGVGDTLNADRAEDVTAARLGAPRWQAQAFRSAVFSYVLRWWVTEREVLDAVWNGGAEREMTAEYADEQLDLADRLTGVGG